jgi:hypothetical protein
VTAAELDGRLDDERSKLRGLSAELVETQAILTATRATNRQNAELIGQLEARIDTLSAALARLTPQSQ